MNKIFISKPDILYDNNKITITIYVYNREIRPLYKNLLIYLKKIYEICRYIYINIEKGAIKKEDIMEMWYVKLIMFRKFILKFYLNKYKFDKVILNILGTLINKILNKKIVFNIINLKSIAYNSDLFTKILTLNLRKRFFNIYKATDIILNKAVLPKINNFKERSIFIKRKKNFIGNVHKNLNYIFISNKYNLNNLLKEIYLTNTTKKNGKIYLIHKGIFNNIKYKLMRGIRLEIKGRLTKRYRADRALYNVSWKGGLKNIDSSFKKLSAVHFIGYRNSNVEYSLYTSKRRIGAYAIKGWLGGK